VAYIVSQKLPVTHTPKQVMIRSQVGLCFYRRQSVDYYKVTGNDSANGYARLSNKCK